MATQTTRKQVGGSLAVLLGLIGAFEGYRLHAYADPVGIPTICAGETHGVKLGDVATPDECRDMTAAQAQASIAAVQAMLTHPQPDTRLGALADLEYNIGQTAFRHSSTLRFINAGQIQQGCDAMRNWKYAGGKVWPGLVRRREAERRLCLQ